ncbi:MAG TPA: TolC family protein [Kiritimatiellia bacterium]|nr:TolC family protein [Kiritimatiellia bacterium]
MRGGWWWGVVAGLPLMGCMSVGPNYEASRFMEEGVWAGPVGSGMEAMEPELAWWEQFGDPLLTSYLERAREENRDLQAAAARVERARALRQGARSELGPRVDAEGGVSRRRSAAGQGDSSGGRYSTLFDAGLSASWEVDLFGGTRRANEAAQARLEGEMERYRATELALLAEVARSYYEVRGAQRRMANTRANIELQGRTYELVENLFLLGEASEFDLSRAKGQLQLTQSRLPELGANERAGIYRLSILVGLPPGALVEEMEVERGLPPVPDLIPLGQRSDVLRRRPDVRAAERSLAAATADIGSATADLFPRFSLLGTLGRSADTVDGLRDSLSTRGLAASFVRWPVFQSGQIRARIAAEKAEAKEAAAVYEQTVLAALADAEGALIRYLSQEETKVLLREVVASNERSFDLARRLFNAGEEGFLSVLDAERELIRAQDDLILSETEAVLRLIGLYTALGGGWDVDGE